jgi:hypothetical protein
MPDPEEDPPGPSAQKSTFKSVDSDQFQSGTRKGLGYQGIKWMDLLYQGGNLQSF